MLGVCGAFLILWLVPKRVHPSNGQGPAGAGGVDGGPDIASAWSPNADEQAILESTEALLYGRVVDDEGKAVPGATIVALPNRDPWISGPRRTEITADKDGSFVVRESNAPTVHVSASAAGYYTGADSARTFSFAGVPDSMPDSLKDKVLPPVETTLSAPLCSCSGAWGAGSR